MSSELSPVVPADIVEAILIRLPVKSLKRFRSVSKAWNDEIEHKYFTKLHLNHSISTGINQSPIAESEGTIYSLDSRSLEKLTKIVTPFNDKAMVFNTCNGLLLVETNDSLIIFNPSREEDFFVLPNPPAANVYGNAKIEEQSICLGYDPAHDDYKVFIINPMVEGDKFVTCESAIYSRKSNEWRIRENFTRDMMFRGFFEAFGLFVASGKGALFAINKYDSTHIVALDVESEGFDLVPMPNFKEKTIPSFMVHVFDGSLAVLCRYPDNRIDFWVMKEYRVKKTWNMLLSVTLGHPETVVIPLVYSKSRTEVLLGSNIPEQQLLWYDLRKRTVRSFQVTGLPTTAVFSWVCVESNVSVGGTQIIEEKKKQHEEET